MSLTRREAILTGAVAVKARAAMPAVPFGGASISKLIVGGNPVSAISHVDAALSQEMMDYFTAENVKRLLQSCDDAGVNTWLSRSDRHILRLLHEYRLEGGRIEWIAQTATEIDFNRNLGEIVREKPVGIYLHGVQTDRAWTAGTMDKVHDMVRQIRDTGIRTGLATHIPEVIDYVESKQWDVDFYMACLYNLSRTDAEKERVAGRPYPGELFWDADREQMLRRVSQTAKQCLVFKVYGASRHCASEEKMFRALQLVAKYAKPGDALVVGMFPKRSEQVAQNARLLRSAFAAA